MLNAPWEVEFTEVFMQKLEQIALACYIEYYQKTNITDPQIPQSFVEDILAGANNLGILPKRGKLKYANIYTKLTPSGRHRIVYLVDKEKKCVVVFDFESTNFK